MSKLPNWVLVAGLAVMGCTAHTTSWGDFGDGGEWNGSSSGGASGSADAGATSGDDGGSGTASSGSSGSSSGGGASSGGDAAVTPFCTSGVVSHKSEGLTMTPGEACVSCHANSGGEAPMLTLGGTVYPTAHEPDDCNGVNVTGATIVITDAQGVVKTLTVDSVGNFQSSASITTPYTASISYSGNIVAMVTPQTSGDCNSCHDVNGENGAPGRIMLP